MRPFFLLPAIALFLNSCATLVNEPNKTITVYTTQPSKIRVSTDSNTVVQTRKNRAKITVPRSKSPVTIIAVTDSLQKSVAIPSQNSAAYYGNVFTYGIGFFFDRNKPKRYTYPSAIYINPADTMTKYDKYRPAGNRGETYLHISMPHVNMFLQRPAGESKKANTGFIGFSLGLDYYHHKNQFFNITAGGVLDFPIPFPVVLDRFGKHEDMNAAYAVLSNNHRLKRFTVGYGPAYSHYSWSYAYRGEVIDTAGYRAPQVKSHRALGLQLSTYYQFTNSFHIGLVYRPTFIQLGGNGTSRYEHVISLDLAWKIRL